MKPLVSIIIPTYNYGRYLRRAVDSALNQSYANVEVIVVDDGSSDDTQAILSTYGDRIANVRQPNRGASAARNLGLARARGEYIAFLDADDAYAPDNIARKLDYLLRHPEYRWCYSNCVWVDASGREGLRGDQIERMLISLRAEGKVFLRALEGYLLGSNLFLFHRDVLHAIGGFDEALAVMEDYDLFIRAAHDYAIGYVDEVLVRIFEHADSHGSAGGKPRGYFYRWRLNRKLASLYPEAVRQVGRPWRRMQADVYRNLAQSALARAAPLRAQVLLRTSLRYRRWQPGALLLQLRICRARMGRRA